jgi:hypothetical protein
MQPKYTVYDNKTDFPVIVDGTARECAKIMGITYRTFLCLNAPSHRSKRRRWTILKSVGEVDDG